MRLTVPRRPRADRRGTPHRTPCDRGCGVRRAGTQSGDADRGRAAGPRCARAELRLEVAPGAGRSGGRPPLPPLQSWTSGFLPRFKTRAPRADARRNLCASSRGFVLAPSPWRSRSASAFSPRAGGRAGSPGGGGVAGRACLTPQIRESREPPSPFHLIKHRGAFPRCTHPPFWQFSAAAPQRGGRPGSAWQGRGGGVPSRVPGRRGAGPSDPPPLLLIPGWPPARPDPRSSGKGLAEPAWRPLGWLLLEGKGRTPGAPGRRGLEPCPGGGAVRRVWASFGAAPQPAR